MLTMIHLLRQEGCGQAVTGAAIPLGGRLAETPLSEQRHFNEGFDAATSVDIRDLCAWIVE